MKRVGRQHKRNTKKEEGETTNKTNKRQMKKEQQYIQRLCWSLVCYCFWLGRKSSREPHASFQRLAVQCKVQGAAYRDRHIGVRTNARVMCSCLCVLSPRWFVFFRLFASSFSFVGRSQKQQREFQVASPHLTSAPKESRADPNRTQRRHTGGEYTSTVSTSGTEHTTNAHALPQHPCIHAAGDAVCG